MRACIGRGEENALVVVVLQLRTRVGLAERDHATYDRDLYARRRERATREAPDPAEVDALAALVGVGPLGAAVLEGRPEAERQLELPVTAVPADVVARTLAF